MRAENVSAVLVTRGDVDLEPILATLPYDEVIVWDNSERGDARTFGRYLAMAEARNDVCYFQDDDLIFTEHERLLAEYEPDRITVNMPSPWYEECAYDVFRCRLVGAGSLVPRGISESAFATYLVQWPKDELFLDYCDFVHGILTPSERFDFGYTILPHALAPNRISTRPGADARKATVIQRALDLREGMVV